MYLLKLIFKNALRHKLRTSLTVTGIVVATVAFGLLSTVVDAWYAGAESASSSRLVTRNSISLVFSLPLTYDAKIRRIDGVKSVSYANWFGGIYKEPRNFFPQFAIDAPTYLAMYPEFKIPEAQKTAFLRDRKGCILGRKTADNYGIKLGDVINLKGTIFPGNWEFVVRGIYDGAEARTDTSQMFFHWSYLNETLQRTVARRANWVGVYVIDITSPDRAAEVSRAIDQTFKNSLAETLTETEQAFQLGFVSMTEAIVVAVRAVSFLVIVIIMAVMANTMAMTARERIAEYATLKALGFGPGFLSLLIAGESLLIALVGGLLGVALTFPIAGAFSRALGTFFPVFNLSGTTIVTQIACAITVGIIAALFPMRRAATVPIVDGLRSIG